MTTSSFSRAALTILSAATLAGAAFTMSGCSSATPSDSSASSASAEHAAANTAETAVTFTEGWAKAGSGMTGAFGVLHNNSDKAITLESADSPIAKKIELHETVTSGSSAVMRPVEGGFVIPAHGSFTLEPGGNHIMFMQMPKATVAGDEVALTLHFSDGSTLKQSVLVKDYSGAQENYENLDSKHDMNEMQHGESAGSSSDH